MTQALDFSISFEGQPHLVASYEMQRIMLRIYSNPSHESPLSPLLGTKDTYGDAEDIF
jgi:hypothetical protein